MRITWLGHSCFRLESQESSLVIDPYDDPEGSLRLPPMCATADAVVCSHEHTDHNNRSAVSLTGRPCALQVETIKTYHDDCLGQILGSNTIHIVSDGTVRVAHLGDLGHLLTPEQIAMLGKIDALMVNVGGYVQSEAAFAAKLAEQISPTVILPMHYRSPDFGIPTMGTVGEFLSLVSPSEFSDHNFIDISPGEKPRTVVLRFIPA